MLAVVSRCGHEVVRPPMLLALTRHGNELARAVTVASPAINESSPSQEVCRWPFRRSVRLITRNPS